MTPLTFARLARFAAIAASLALLIPACSDSSDPFEGKSCTELACLNGLQIDFQYREAGTYAVEVTVDGDKTTCNATLPLTAAPEPNEPCAAKGIYLTRSGSALAAPEQFIGGLHLSSTTATSLQIKVTRDGTLLEERSFTPQYTVTPGPNGPDCEPKECRAATFPLVPSSG